MTQYKYVLYFQQKQLLDSSNWLLYKPLSCKPLSVVLEYPTWKCWYFLNTLPSLSFLLYLSKFHLLYSLTLPWQARLSRAPGAVGVPGPEEDPVSQAAVLVKTPRLQTIPAQLVGIIYRGERLHLFQLENCNAWSPWKACTGTSTSCSQIRTKSCWETCSEGKNLYTCWLS